MRAPSPSGGVSDSENERGFDPVYRRNRESALHARLFGQGLPVEVEPYSFVPLAGMELIASLAAPSPGGLVCDLGCGRGGPGLWLARRWGSRLFGIDGSPLAVADAAARAPLFAGAGPVAYAVGDVAAACAASHSADVVLAIDVIQLVADRRRLLLEVRRMLAPRGIAVLTTWEGHGEAPERFPRDLAAELANLGFRLTHRSLHPHWLERQLAIYDAALELAEPDAAVAALAAEGRNFLAFAGDVRHVLFVAQTTAASAAR